MTLTLRLAPTIQEGDACVAPTAGTRRNAAAFRILRGTHDFADIFILRCARCPAGHVGYHEMANRLAKLSDSWYSPDSYFGCFFRKFVSGRPPRERSGGLLGNGAPTLVDALLCLTNLRGG